MRTRPALLAARLLTVAALSAFASSAIAQKADIAKGQTGDMKATYERRKKARSDLAAALSAPTIEKATVERLRAEQSSDFDMQSKKRTQMMLDIAAVLSPEQRVKMRELMEKRRGSHGWGHGRDDRGPAQGMDKPTK